MILDRSTLEAYAGCPHKGYLKVLFDACKAKAQGKTVFAWEEALLAAADRRLIEALLDAAACGTNSSLCETGIQIHAVIEEAFKACDGDLSLIPDYISDRLPHVRPDLQPDAIRAGRYICDMVADIHIKVLAIEKQISVKTPDGESLTCRLDLLGQGLNRSLHVFDWKSGWLRRTNGETFDSFQAQFAASLLWGQSCYSEVEVIHYWYMETRFGTKAYAKFDRNEEHPRLPHLTQQIAFSGRIDETVKLVRDAVQECRPTDTKCCQCDMIRFCKLAHLDADEISKDPKSFVDKLAYDIASVARRKKAATAWVKAKGPIAGTAVVFDRKRPSERFSCELIDGGKPFKINHECIVGPVTGDDEVDAFFK
jgi:hypothetical protein